MVVAFESNPRHYGSPFEGTPMRDGGGRSLVRLVESPHHRPPNSGRACGGGGFVGNPPGEVTPGGGFDTGGTSGPSVLMIAKAVLVGLAVVLSMVAYRAAITPPAIPISVSVDAGVDLSPLPPRAVEVHSVVGSAVEGGSGGDSRVLATASVGPGNQLVERQSADIVSQR